MHKLSYRDKDEQLRFQSDSVESLKGEISSIFGQLTNEFTQLLYPFPQHIMSDFLAFLNLIPYPRCWREEKKDLNGKCEWLIVFLKLYPGNCSRNENMASVHIYKVSLSHNSRKVDVISAQKGAVCSATV